MVKVVREPLPKTPLSRIPQSTEQYNLLLDTGWDTAILEVLRIVYNSSYIDDNEVSSDIAKLCETLVPLLKSRAAREDALIIIEKAAKQG